MDEYNVSACFSSDDETDGIFESPCTQDPTSSSALIPTTEISLNSSVSDVVLFLKSNGIPEKFCRVFEENYIDGNEFMTLDEKDVKTLVPPMGLARKILRLLPKKSSSSPPVSTVALPSARPTVPSVHSSTPSHSDSDNFGPENVSPGLTCISIPDHWRPEVEQCIVTKNLTGSVRNEIVRTLVHLLFSKFKKPSRINCEEFARKLILKYPFMKDDLGNGYQSWSDKMVERVRNVIKRDCKRTKQSVEEDESPAPKQKRSKKAVDLLRRYPVNVTSTLDLMPDRHSVEELKRAIENELAKGRPRDLVLAPLLKSTYEERRMHILSVTASVEEFLTEYPALARPAMIEQEMGLIFAKPDIKTHFIMQWTTKYVPAILEYASKSVKKNIRSILATVKHEDSVSKGVGALKILGESLDKKESIVYMYEEYNESDHVDIICKKPPLRNQPRIAAYKLEARTQYFIICEQKVLCEVPNFDTALFIAFSSYYCFNLEYPLKARNLFSFFQDYILEQPDSFKKSAGYLAVVSDIKRNL